MAAGNDNFFQAVVLLALNAGASGSFLANNNTVQIVIPSGKGAGTYEPYPEFEMKKFPERSGGFEESDIEIEISDDAAFIQSLVSGYTFAPVTIDVYEYFFDEVTGTESQMFHLFSGRLTKAISNVNDNRGVVRLIGNNSKNRLDFSLGVTANIQCSWNLGDKNCTATLITLDRTVDTINNTVMTVTVAPPPGTYPSGLFKKGYVQKDDIRILIKEWVSGVTFFLAKPVPPDWTGEVVTLVSGCDRSRDTCIEQYDNLSRFGGFGYLMAAHNPVYEEP